MNKFAVVIPTFNNKDTIKAVIEDVLSYGYRVIVVDDGSDIEVESLIHLNQNLEIIRHRVNQGKGEAILSGTKRSKELGFTHIITIDGDGQHLASEIEKLIKALTKENQIVIGARNFKIEDVPFGSKIGRWFSTIWVVLQTFKNITDSLSGYRLYPVSIVDLEIEKRRFDFEIEVLIKHEWSGGDIIETNVECFYPKSEKRVTHFKKFQDTLSIVKLHLKLLPKRFLTLLKRLFNAN